LVLAGLFWAGAAIIRQIELPYFVLFLYSMASAALLVLPFFVWWWTRRSLRLSERALGFFAVIVTGVAALFICDKSIGAFGLLFTGLPLVLTAWTLWMVAARSLGLRYASLGALVVMILAWSPFAVQRIDGVAGDLHADIHWRWTPSAEDMFKAELASHKVESPTGAAPTWAPVTTPNTWTEFRGPARDGVVRGVTIPTDWKAKPPQLKWKRRVGPAWSSMTVIGDRLFTQEQRGDDEAVVCYDAGTGQEIWAHTENARFEETVSGAGPRATPTFAMGRIFTLGATGILTCLDAATGAKVWSHAITSDAESKPPMWGFSASPLVSQNLVFVFGGGDTGKSLLAYRASSGELAWAANAGALSYSSPQAETIGGKQQILIVSDDSLASFDPETGKPLWHAGQAMPGAPRTEQPHLVGSSQLLAASISGIGIALVDVNADQGEWKVAEKWKSSDMKPEFPDMVVHKGHAYGFDISTFCCVDLSNGKRKWKAGRYGHGQVILLADQDLLLVLSEKGEAVLLKASPERHEELGHFQALNGKTWNHPVVAGGRLYARNAEEMACYELGAP
jgi:outer membrane protein assembly factor BamB